MSPAEKMAERKAKMRAARPSQSRLVRKRVFACAARGRRRKLGLSIREVADAIGMTVSGLFEVEKGGNCELMTAVKLAQFFKCEITELFQPLS